MKYLPPLLGHIPRQIDDPSTPHLHGFPFNLSFASLHWPEGEPRNEGEKKPCAALISCYWPDPGTFEETDQEKVLDYWNERGGNWWVRVVYHKKDESWEVRKYRGGELKRAAFGRTFRGAMIHATLGGPEPIDNFLPVLRG